MKLLLITADYPPVRSGEANHAFYLGLNLARRGVEVHVLTSKIEGAVRHPSFTVHPLIRRWSWAALPRLLAFLKRCAPDGVLLIHLGTMYDCHPMVTFLPTLAKAVLPSVRVVTQFENLSDVAYWRLPFWTRLVRKGLVRAWAGGEGTDPVYGALLRDSDHVIVLNGRHGAALVGHRAQVEQQCSVIPPPPMIAFCLEEGGAARKRGRAALGVGADDFLLVYFGYIYRGKGVETLLRAVQLVARRRPRVRLAMVGGGVLEHFAATRDPLDSRGWAQQMLRLPQELGIADRVAWTGGFPLESDRASLYLRAADACVLPFDQGIFLNNSSFAAAAAHGLPMLTTRGATLEPAFRHGENVFLCPPRDPELLAAAIETLLGDPDLCRRLGAGALRLAQEWFSWDKAIERTLAAFDSAPASGGAAG